MKRFKLKVEDGNISVGAHREKGAALVIALLIMLLLMGFVAVVLSRVNSETIITSNDTSENRTLNAAQAQVESNSRDFKSLFSRKLAPSVTDIDIIRDSVIEGFTDYDFTRRTITQKRANVTTVITEGDYIGLNSVRDEWEIDVTAKDRITQVESRIRRSFNNDRIPLFQFGMFYEDDLELNRPPLFSFGGRVHTNANLFITASSVNANPAGGIYFKSKATVVGEIVNDIWKMGTPLAAGTDNQNSVFFADASGANQQLLTNQASVNCVNPSGPNVFAAKPNLPNCSARSLWDSFDKLPFQGNLDNHKPRLDLPLYRLGVNLVELVKRGKNVGDMVKDEINPDTVIPVTAGTKDEPVLAYERFINKQGLRVTLADAQNKLPGCAGALGPGADNNACGVRLDLTTSYQPKPMQDNATYVTTPLNVTRFSQKDKGMWIKVETVDFDYDNSVPITKDITEDILSLGVTEPAPFTSDFQIKGHIENPLNPGKSYRDSRSIIKLQRYTIPGPAITNSGTDYLTNQNIGGSSHNIVTRYTNVAPIPATPTALNPAVGCDIANAPTKTSVDAFSAPEPRALYTSKTEEDTAHLQCVRFGNIATASYTTVLVPFPIQLFDTREGIANDRPDTSNGVPGTNSFGNDRVPSAGVMSMIDIDVANLRRFLNGGAGSFDNLLPTDTPFAKSKNVVGASLLSTDVPQNKGWVLYVSDRRGDADFDGEYDMEDVIPDGVQQFNEDLNGTGAFTPGNGSFERLYYSSNTNLAANNYPSLKANKFFEAPRYADTVLKSQAATSDHGYYRRGVRLINGSVLPGIYDRTAPTLTRGFTFATENGVYVRGNYNATSATATGTTAPAPPENYLPQGGTLTVAGSANALNHIPAAIVSDATTILSNNWNDSQSFATPFAQEQRVASATQIRFALLTGDVITGKNSDTNLRPSDTGGLGNGGVHNFKRFLEVWTGVRLNYVGSLVNLFNSRNNNGFFKCCAAAYNPPIRDWTFDTTFVDPNRLPPGTPYIYSMNFTGFQRVND